MHGQVVEPPRWHVKRAGGSCAFWSTPPRSGKGTEGRHVSFCESSCTSAAPSSESCPQVWRPGVVALVYGRAMVKVFLYAPQDFRNLCVVARTLEVLGHRECYVFDPWRLVRERYGKARVREQRVVSAGAFDKVTWHRVEAPSELFAAQRGRLVATVADAHAVPLGSFRFEVNDWVLFGSESAGLPEEVLTAAQAKVTIPSRGETQSLNLAVSLGVVLFEAQRQLLRAQGADSPNTH